MRKILFPVLVLLGLTLGWLGAAEPLTVRMVRHGQPGVAGTDFRPEDKAQWIHLGLTPLGRKQAEMTGAWLKKEGIAWQTVISSPQERAAETADILCAAVGCKFELDPELREIGNAIPETLPELHRRFARLTPEAKLDLTPAQRKHFKETSREQGIRGTDFLRKLVRRGIRGPVLVVTHGGLMGTTQREVSGKSVIPWNCGMMEFKVWPDGRIEPGQTIRPDVLPGELVTHNQRFFTQEPYYKVFLPHPGPRPDGIDWVNREFRKFLAGERSSWRPYRSPGAEITVGRDGITVKPGEKPAGIDSPEFPLSAGREYHLKAKVGGRGRGAILLLRSSSLLKFELSEEQREIELKFAPSAAPEPYLVRVLVEPGGIMTIADCTLEPVE